MRKIDCIFEVSLNKTIRTGPDKQKTGIFLPLSKSLNSVKGIKSSRRFLAFLLWSELKFGSSALHVTRNKKWIYERRLRMQDATLCSLVVSAEECISAGESMSCDQETLMAFQPIAESRIISRKNLIYLQSNELQPKITKAGGSCSLISTTLIANDYKASESPPTSIC